MNKELSQKQIERREKKKLKKEERKKNRNSTYAFSIVSLIFGILGVLVALTIKSIPFDFTTILTKAHNTIWDAIVIELFTFLLWLIAMFVIIVVLIILFLICLFAGPLLCLVGLIFGIIQICLNRKWWSWVTLFTSIGLLILSFYLFSLGVTVL